MKKISLAMIVIIVALATFCSCDSLKNTYRVRFTQGQEIEEAIVAGINNVGKVSVTRTGHYGHLGGQFNCRITLDSPIDSDIIEKTVGCICGVLKDRDDLYLYFLENCEVFSIWISSVSEKDSLITIDTCSGWNFEKWAYSDGNEIANECIYTVLTETVAGSSVRVNGEAHNYEVRKNSHTAGFILPLKQTLSELGISYEENGTRLVVTGIDKNIEIKVDEGGYKLFENKEDLQATDYYDPICEDNSFAKSTELNGGYYPYLMCEWKNEELYVDNATFSFLLEQLHYDGITVQPDYTNLSLSIQSGLT